MQTFNWIKLDITSKLLKLKSSIPGFGAHIFVGICRLEIGHLLCLLDWKGCFNFNFKWKQFWYFADSLRLQQQQRGTLCWKQGSFQSSAILRSVLSQSFLEREHLSNFCNLSSSRCSFTTFLLHFHQLHLCICSRMTCKSGHCPCRSECNKFKKSHSKPATDSMKATKPTAHWQYHHLRLWTRDF